MNQNQSVLPPEFNAEWDFEGTEFPLPNEGVAKGVISLVLTDSISVLHLDVVNPLQFSSE